MLTAGSFEAFRRSLCAPPGRGPGRDHRSQAHRAWRLGRPPLGADRWPMRPPGRWLQGRGGLGGGQAEEQATGAWRAAALERCGRRPGRLPGRAPRQPWPPCLRWGAILRRRVGQPQGARRGRASGGGPASELLPGGRGLHTAAAHVPRRPFNRPAGGRGGAKGRPRGARASVPPSARPARGLQPATPALPPVAR